MLRDSLKDILQANRFSAAILFLLLVVHSLSEILGVGMVMPFLEIITDSSSTDSLRFLQPLIEKFPPQHTIMLVSGLMAGLFILRNLLLILQTAYSAWFVSHLRYSWTMGIMRKYMHAVYSYHVSQKQGVLLNNLIKEPSIAAKSIFSVIEFFSQILLITLLYVLLLVVNWQVTMVITVGGALLLSLVLRTANRYSTSVGKRQLALNQEVTAIGAESINGVRQIKIFSSENVTFKRLDAKLRELIRIIIKYRIIIQLPLVATEIVVICGIFALLLFVQYFTEIAILDIVPTIGVFVLALRRLIPAFSNLFSSRMNINTYLPSLELVHGLNNNVIETENLDNGEPVSSLESDIVFDNVFFRYDHDQPLFEGLTFTIPRGQITALVGLSGSGKSTIIDLLTGFYKSQQGTIGINGMDIKEISMNSWRSLVGYVSQDTYLFSASVRDNILMGKPSATEEEVLEAGRKANADEFIRSLPDGYETFLGERGLNLSGGQRQRIALARALIRDPQVLILDEATSSLDRESERFIQKAIDSFAGLKTVIIISHRLVTVQNANRIFVLEKGQIVEQGRFDELVNTEGRFHELSGT